MKHVSLRTRCALALALAGMLAIGPAMAEKPSWAGGGKADKGERRNTGAIGSRDSAKPSSAKADILLVKDGSRTIVESILNLGRR